jgi:hypothetical protein
MSPGATRIVAVRPFLQFASSRGFSDDHVESATDAYIRQLGGPRKRVGALLGIARDRASIDDYRAGARALSCAAIKGAHGEHLMPAIGVSDRPLGIPCSRPRRSFHCSAVLTAGSVT